MSVPPPKPLLKWGEMIDWLKANGVRRAEARRYIAAGKIKPRTLPPSQVKHYSAAEIQREILDQLQA
jgi:predicted site-specific integrase-resolvase